MENRQCKEPYGADLLMRYQKGDVVRLAGSVMPAEFRLMLCNDAGELLEIDGGIQEVINDMARVLSRECCLDLHHLPGRKDIQAVW